MYFKRDVTPALPQPAACTGCPLHGVGTGFAVPEGTGINGVIAVAERLGDHEVEEGLPLRPSGAAGSIFERALRQLGLSRGSFKIHNILSCKSPGLDLQGMPWEFPAIDHCRVHRDRLLLDFPDSSPTYKKKVILAMGDVATRTLTGLGGWGAEKFDSLRGYPIDTPYGLVYPTYNPAKIYRESKLFGVLKYDIQRAVNIAQYGWDPPRYKYTEFPSQAEAWAFYERAKALCASGDLPLITCDIENDFDKDTHTVRVTSVQFSLAKNEGIFLEVNASNKPIIYAIFALKAQFWFHNGWRHDQPILTRSEYYSDGVLWTVTDPLCVTFGGPIEDSLWAFHHAQPDLTSQEGDDGLGISSKMGLQYVASLYGFPRRWKHLVKVNLREYGVADVDALQYIVPPLIEQLKEKGQWDSYHRHVMQYDPILVRITERGIPVSETRRQEVKADFAAQRAAVWETIQKTYPNELKNIDPKKGYTRPPVVKEGKVRWEPYDPCGATVAFGPPIPGRGFGNYQWLDEDGVWRDMELRLFTGLSVKKKVQCNCFTLITKAPDKVNKKGVVTPGKAYAKPKKVYAQDCPLCAGKKAYTQVLTQENRWVKVLPFKPSKDQIIRYMEYRKHKVPKKRGAGGERTTTTEYKELEKLAKNTKDPLYTNIVTYRKLEKIESTYVDAWVPQQDGCVHPTLLGSTATAQLASEAPNALNPPKHNEELANKFRSMIVAPDGHTFLEMDYKSYHGATLAAESGDEVYYKIAVKAGDAHSFLTSYMVKEPIDPTLPLEELIAKLEYIKKKYKHVRNTKAKPTNLGYGFGMQGPGMYERNQDSFDAKPCLKHPKGQCGETCYLVAMLDDLYAGNYKWRQAQVEEAFNNGGRKGSGWLLSKYNHIRWFHSIYQYRMQTCRNCNGHGCAVCDTKGTIWKRQNGGDLEDIYAFKPANHAHCNFREVQLRLEKRGLLEKYNCILPYHDALYFVVRDELVEEAIHNVYAEMVQPIKVLAHPKLCPDGLVVDVDVNVGKSWDQMRGYKVAA